MFSFFLGDFILSKKSRNLKNNLLPKLEQNTMRKVLTTFPVWLFNLKRKRFFFQFEVIQIFYRNFILDVQYIERNLSESKNIEYQIVYFFGFLNWYNRNLLMYAYTIKIFEKSRFGVFEIGIMWYKMSNQKIGECNHLKWYFHPCSNICLFSKNKITARTFKSFV